MNKEPAKGGIEQDVFSGWRRVLCYTQRPGICKWAKRKNNRRARRNAKNEVQRSVDQRDHIV